MQLAELPANKMLDGSLDRAFFADLLLQSHGRMNLQLGVYRLEIVSCAISLVRNLAELFVRVGFQWSFSTFPAAKAL